MMVYVVGGTLRDQILGLKPKDMDYVVDAPSFEAMHEYILSRVAEPKDIFLVAEKYLTVRARIPGIGPADFALCRKDGLYTDGRRPDNVEPATLLEDLARRDFTMNAMARGEDGVLIDPHDGMTDIKFRLIRCVGVAEDRLREDSLRMLRAIRFCVTKNFVISPDIEKCLNSNEFLELLSNVSLERVREELYKAFLADTRKTMHLLTQVYPGLGAKLFENDRLYLIPAISA